MGIMLGRSYFDHVDQTELSGDERFLASWVAFPFYVAIRGRVQSCISVSFSGRLKLSTPKPTTASAIFWE